MSFSKYIYSPTSQKPLVSWPPRFSPWPCFSLYSTKTPGPIIWSYLITNNLHSLNDQLSKIKTESMFKIWSHDQAVQEDHIAEWADATKYSLSPSLAWLLLCLCLDQPCTEPSSNIIPSGKPQSIWYALFPMGPF